MTDRLDDQWVHRDYPVLREAARIIDAGSSPIGAPFRAIVEATGLEFDDVHRAARALESDSLVELRIVIPVDRGSIKNISGEARRKVGLWPDHDHSTEDLIRYLERQVEDATPADRSRWQRVRDTFADAGQDVTAKVIAEIVARQAGL